MTFGETFGAATGVSAPSYRGGFADGMGRAPQQWAATDFFSRGGAESAEGERLDFLRVLRGSA